MSLFPCVSSYRWVHFLRSVLFCQPQQQLFTHSSECSRKSEPLTFSYRTAVTTGTDTNSKYNTRAWITTREYEICAAMFVLRSRKFWVESTNELRKAESQLILFWGVKPIGVRVQELCESRGGRPGLCVLTSLLVSVDVKQYWTMLRHWSQLVPNNYVNRHPRTLSITTEPNGTFNRETFIADHVFLLLFF